MSIGAISQDVISVRRVSPNDPMVRAADLPNAREMAASILDGVIAGQASSKRFAALVDSGLQHTRGMATMVEALVANLPASTTTEELDDWKREVEGIQSELASLTEAKASLPEREASDRTNLEMALRLVSGLLPQEEAAKLYQERQEQFDQTHAPLNVSSGFPETEHDGTAMTDASASPLVAEEAQSGFGNLLPIKSIQQFWLDSVFNVRPENDPAP